MSWTLIVMRAPTSAQHPTDLPDEPAPIASQSELVARLSELLPGTKWSSATHGIFATANAGLELDLDGGDPVPYMSMTLRGDYSELEPPIGAVLDSLDLRAVGEDGEFYEPPGS